MTVLARWLWLAAAAVAGGAVALAAGWWHLSNWGDRALNLDQPMELRLEPGDSLGALVQRLVDAGVLEDAWRLRVLAEISGSARVLQAGTYRVGPDHTPRSLLADLTQGAVVTYGLRIPEGITVEALMGQLYADTRLQQDVQAANLTELAETLKLDAPFIEGAFLPETYQFRHGDSVQTLLLRAHDALLRALHEAWQVRHLDVPLDDPWQLLILASIIEKETGQAHERAQISQVFHARLARGMKLQTDPTVIYALGERFDGDIRRADLRLSSPFNTYKHRGLPPTPIALASRAALWAAAQPAEGEYLYFVARGDGTSEFSETLAEHNRAVRRFQLGQSDG